MVAQLWCTWSFLNPLTEPILTGISNKVNTMDLIIYAKTRLGLFARQPLRTLLLVVLLVAVSRIITGAGPVETGVIALVVVVAALLQILYPKK